MAPPTACGLTAPEAAARLEADGPNVLPRRSRTSPVLRFARQLVHFFALLLWAAAGLALVARMPQLSVAIAAVVVLNAVFAFVQEHRADRAADRLQDLLPRRVTVRRDGTAVEVDAAQVVVGDLLLLASGDRVPADAHVLRAHGLLVDTSTLTGESAPVRLEEEAELWAGTFVVEGEAEAVVLTTGASTRLAGIAALTQAQPRLPSPLTRELHRVVRTLAAIATAVGALFFALAVALGDPPSQGFVFAIGVTVALVPEALLPTVTLALAWGAEQMAHRNVLVRNLDAVETLGSTTFICTDKTGTLTRNQMSVVAAWVPGGELAVEARGYDPTVRVALPPGPQATELVELAAAAAHCSSGYAFLEQGVWRAHGDPMEAAVDVFARRLGVDTPTGRAVEHVDVRFPFDPHRRRMSVVRHGQVLVKGAPDAVLELCEGAAVAGARGRLAALTDRGLRVLAVAARSCHGRLPRSADEAESHLRLLGLLGLEDPPRPGVGSAVDACRGAGVRVAMVTGDHPATAAAIGLEVGLRTSTDPVLVGDDLPDDDELLGGLLDRDGVVVARVSPEQKLRIARSLRARGHVVAMTGDGVNDGPALREADIGIAMGASGTDVAREAADLVLLDDRFASIVAGIEQGRATFLNVRRFLTYHLTDNVAELTPFVVWALSGGDVPLALGVLQILALDIGTDTMSAVALGGEAPGRGVLRRPPVSGRLLNRTVLTRAFGVLGPTVAAGAMAAFFAVFLAGGWRPGQVFPDDLVAGASGAAFLAVVLGQAANAFACRSSTRRPGELGWTSNRLLLLGKSTELLLTLGMLLVVPLADVLGHAAPPLAGVAVAALTAVAVLVVDGLSKTHRRRGGGPV